MLVCSLFRYIAMLTQTDSVLSVFVLPNVLISY